MKKIKLAIGLSIILASSTMIIFAVSETVQNINAQIRQDYIISIDGEVQTFEDANGNKVYPIIYEGTTYLPVRAIGEVMDKNVFWNADLKKIDLVQRDLDEPDMDIAEWEIPVILVNSINPNTSSIIYSNFKKIEKDYVEVTLTSISDDIKTYNITLRNSITGDEIQTYSNIKSGHSVKFENLTIGNEYSFILNSDNAPMDALEQSQANAIFKIH